jgi:hypothetical protein
MLAETGDARPSTLVHRWNAASPPAGWPLNLSTYRDPVEHIEALRHGIDDPHLLGPGEPMFWKTTECQAASPSLQNRLTDLGDLQDATLWSAPSFRRVSTGNHSSSFGCGAAIFQRCGQVLKP